MRALRFFFGVFLLVAIIAAGIYLFRTQLGGLALRLGAAQVGVENLDARITQWTSEKIVLEKISLGPDGNPSIRLDDVVVTYDVETAWRERRVESVSIGPGAARVRVAADGRVTIDGVALPSGRDEKDGATALPFSSLTVAPIALTVHSPLGEASGSAEGSYHKENGGALSIAINADEASLSDTQAEDASLAADVTLQEDGGIDLSMSLKGDFKTRHAILRGADFAFVGKGASWRDAIAGQRDTLSFAGSLVSSVREAPVEAIPALSFLQGNAVDTNAVEAIKTLGLESKLELSFEKGRIDISAMPGLSALLLSSDTGALLSIDPIEDAQLASLAIPSSDGVSRVSSKFAIEGGEVPLQGSLNAELLDGEWRAQAPVRVGRYSSDILSVRDVDFVVDAVGDGSAIDASFTVETAMERALIGRLSVRDTPIDISGRAAADLVGRTISIDLDEECMEIPRTDLAIEEQDSELRIRGGALCQTSGPVAVLQFSDDLEIGLQGSFSARSARYRLASTLLDLSLIHI